MDKLTAFDRRLAGGSRRGMSLDPTGRRCLPRQGGKELARPPGLFITRHSPSIGALLVTCSVSRRLRGPFVSHP
jgi:hypothetical protein